MKVLHAGISTLFAEEGTVVILLLGRLPSRASRSKTGLGQSAITRLSTAKSTCIHADSCENLRSCTNFCPCSNCACLLS